MPELLSREDALRWREELRAGGKRVVTTNGCFDVLHAGHVALLQAARERGDALLVLLNSDASVRALKGPTRPVHSLEARAAVLLALRSVEAVVAFEEDTPVELLRVLRPDVHIKGGDYSVESLPETPIVREGGGEVVIVPLVEGFSSTKAIKSGTASEGAEEQTALAIIPARYGSTRFPGKPLVDVGGQLMIERVVRQVLQAQLSRPVMVATDDARIARAVSERFPSRECVAIMTGRDLRTGTDRLAEVVRARLSSSQRRDTIIVNVQGDEPFVEPAHVSALVQILRSDASLRMATLATPLDQADAGNPNIVKVVCDAKGRALYFSRSPIPFHRRDAEIETPSAPMLRHLGLYAYRADWLLEMASLPSSPLEEIEKLEQLRALEAGIAIGVAVVTDVTNIAIDTPEDLDKAREYLSRHA